MDRLNTGFTGKPHKHIIARSTAEAVAAHEQVFPSKSSMSRNIFAGKAGRHFDTDYDGARGLSIVGRGKCETKKLIEFTQYTKECKPEIDFIVIALTEDGPEAFDREEALGYDRFIKAAGSSDLEAVKQELREKHLEQKRNEPCEE